MARPPAKELTERELEVMHVFWKRGESTVAEVRDALAQNLCRCGSHLRVIAEVLRAAQEG